MQFPENAQLPEYFQPRMPTKKVMCFFFLATSYKVIVLSSCTLYFDGFLYFTNFMVPDRMYLRLELSSVHWPPENVL